MKANAIQRSVGSDSPATAGKSGDQRGQDGDRQASEGEREQHRVGRQRPSRMRVRGGEVPVGLLHAEGREIGRQKRDRGQERDLTATLGAERAEDDQDAEERQERREDLSPVGERGGTQKVRRPVRGDVGGRIPHYHRRVIVVTTGSIAAPLRERVE